MAQALAHDGVQIQEEERAGRLGTHMAGRLAGGAFASGEVPSIRVAVPKQPQEYLSYGSIDQTIPMMVNTNPPNCYIEPHKLTWA
jgi:hypothetical protein